MKRITRKKVVRFLFWLALAERQPLALLGRVKKLYSEKTFWYNESAVGQPHK